ncbi:MAG TPA: hypothetical protein VHC69_29955 [Polyangiaceae bacterium]|nr:hypothetical protein [Polyangiaceae bacterium]
MNVSEHLVTRSVRGLVRLACALALLGLSVLCFSVIVPRPLPVIFAMSVGHGIGMAAFCCYLLAVVVDAARRERKVPSGGPSVPSAKDEDGLLGVNVKETKR